MHNNLYSKDPFGVFNDTPSFSRFEDRNTPYFPPYQPKTDSSSSWWKVVFIFLAAISFGLIFYCKDALVKGFKKIVSDVNDKVNPEPVEEQKPQPKLLTQTAGQKIERIFLIKDKASWDIPYINKKQQERKAFYSDDLGWTIYE